VTVRVADLGLDLRSVPQVAQDTARLMLKARALFPNSTGTLPPSQVRAYLRPLCGPEQDEAEHLAWLCIQAHVPADAAGWCATCEQQLPCQVIAADTRAIGLHLRIAELEEIADRLGWPKDRPR
jgi:hypothetical protein